MQVVKCDLCGKDITHKKAYYYRSNSEFMSVSTRSYDFTSDYLEPLEMCEECYKRIQAHMETFIRSVAEMNRSL